MHYPSLLPLGMVGLAASHAAGEAIQLEIPKAPPAGTQTLSGPIPFQGYSMEMASFPDMAGNLSAPNKLSYQMLKNLKQITGSAAPIRIGGTTSNHAFWKPEQKESIIQNFAVPGADQPANITWGPSFLESFKVFPKGTKYTVGLTFDSGSEGEDRSVEEAKVFYDGIGKDLFAMEVGNEFNEFPVDRVNTTANPWTLQRFVSEWLERTSAIAQRALPKSAKKIFQAGSYALVVGRDIWTPEETIDLGVNSSSLAKTFCTHQYFGVACRGTPPTLQSSILNRTLLVDLMKYHAVGSAVSVAKGLPYVLGETNSIACQGLAGVSDVFGSALWSIDYALYAASLNVSAIYWQMGTGYRYAPWQATRNGTTEPGPRPLYYGNLFVANALGDSAAQVVPIVNTTSLAGYAVYSGKGRRASLSSIVLVNVDIFNSTTTPADQRSSAEFKLPKELCGGNAKISVRRLTAAGAEVREGMTWAGQSVALDGKIKGKQVREAVEGDVVRVPASEAVLISLD